MSDQADGLRQMVRARSGTTNDPPGRAFPLVNRTSPNPERREAAGRAPSGFFAAIVARLSPRRLAR